MVKTFKSSRLFRMRNRYFPFYELGFRCNPFSVLTREEWAEIAVLPEVVATLVRDGFDHLQLLGEKGRGKTTISLALVEHFTSAGEIIAYEYLPEGQHRLRSELRGLNRFLLDEAQRLGPRWRRSLLRAAKAGLRLVVTSHEDLSAHFDQHRLPLTTVHLETAITHANLETILTRRLTYFALDEKPLVTLADGSVAFLWETFRSDIRAIENLLYEVFQRLNGPGVITTSNLEQVLASRVHQQEP